MRYLRILLLMFFAEWKANRANNICLFYSDAIGECGRWESESPQNIKYLLICVIKRFTIYL